MVYYNTQHGFAKTPIYVVEIYSQGIKRKRKMKKNLEDIDISYQNSGPLSEENHAVLSDHEMSQKTFRQCLEHTGIIYALCQVLSIPEYA